jgi:DnaJ-class molecular chaperone
MTAGIINVRQDWPLSDKDLWYYAENKYGDALNNVRHYETTEVKDSNNRLILPKGKVVDSTFTIPKPGVPTATVNPVVGISNYEYEVRKNMEKSSIYLLKPRYLQQFLNDMRDIMTYQQSSQYIDERNIQTENLSLSMP